MVCLQSPRFRLGHLCATPGALEHLDRRQIMALARRHQQGDWGDVSEDDRAANERAVAHGDERILSAYVIDGQARIWLITEADHSQTTVLLPEEY